MAEATWFLPVAGGGTGGGQFLHVPGLDAVNVYWAADAWPISAAAADIGYRLVKSESFTGSGPGSLGAAYVHWRWFSHQNCDSPPDVTFGCKLVMGTTFGSRIATNNSGNFGPAFTNVIVNAKIRVNDVSRFSGIWLSINDGSNTAVIDSGNLVTALGSALEDWIVVAVESTAISEWEDIDNLRVVLTFQGTDDLSMISSQTTGETGVDVEWFAVHMTD